MNEASYSRQASPISSRSASILNNKFEKQLKDTFGKFKNDPLTFDNLDKILKQYGMDSKLQNENATKSIWNLLRGDLKQGITKQSLFILMQAIGKTYLAQESIYDNSQGVKQIGKFDSEGKFSLTEEEALIVHRKYAPCMIRSGLFHRKTSNPEISNFSFAPHISSRSNALADIARQKVIYNATQESNHASVDNQMSTVSIQELMHYQKIVSEQYLITK